MGSEIAVGKKAKVVGEADVVVVGGGTAGFGAAVAAARAGSSTVLIERYGFLGGNMTASLVGPFMTSYSDDGQTQIVRGVFDELVRRMEAIGGALHPAKIRKGTPYPSYRCHGHDHVAPFDPEAMKYIAMEMALESGVRLVLHSRYLEPLIEDGRIKGVVFLNKSGLEAIRGKVVIDCTGDADVAADAGVPVMVGRESDGLTQPATLFFRMYGIDDEAVQNYIDTHPPVDERPFWEIVDKAKADGRWTWQRAKVAMYKTPKDGVWRFNITRIQKLNFLDSRDLTKAEIEGRRQAFSLVQFLKENMPGFSKAELMDTACQVGVRESRRIAGEYTLTLDDLIAGRAFKDVIACDAYPVDIHDPLGWGGGCTDEFPTANIYQVPLRILIPLKVDGLLVAGRCVSATHEALAAIRTMPCCMAMGQAAGVAAAVSVTAAVPPRAVDVHSVQTELRRQDAYLG